MITMPRFKDTMIYNFFHPEVITYFGQAQVLAFAVFRFILLFIAILAVYDGDHVDCDIPHYREIDSYYCYDLLYNPLPHTLFWIGFTCAVSITWVLYTAFAKYQVNIHKNRLKGIMCLITTAYIVQTVIRLMFEFSGMILQVKYYGFQHPEIYNCTYVIPTTNETEFYSCLVSKAGGKEAYLVIMFLLALFAILVAFADIAYIFYRAWKDRYIYSFPVFVREVRHEDEETLLMPMHSGGPTDSTVKFDLLNARTVDNVTKHLPKPVPYYYSRQELTQEIQDRLLQHKLIALTGIHGVGKTQLAFHIGHEMIAKNQLDMAWVLNSQTYRTVMYGLQVLCEHMEIDVKNIYEDGMTEEDLLGMFLDRVCFKLGKKDVKSYFVFDDCSITVGRVIESRFKNRDKITTVITSTDAHVINDGYLIKNVQGFKKEEAINFLKEEQTFQEEATVNVLRLNDELNYLPMSLALARSYIVNSDGRVTIQEYVRLLKSVEYPPYTDYHANDQDVLQNVNHMLLKSMVLSVNILNAGLFSTSMRRLGLISFLQPADIPEFLLADVLGDDASDFVEVLKSMSLLSLSTIDDLSLCSVHRVLQKVLRMNLAPERTAPLLSDALCLLVNHIDRELKYGKLYHTSALLEPHVNLVLGQIEELPLDLENKLILIHFHEVLANSCCQRELVQEAEEHLETAKRMIYELLCIPEEKLDIDVMETISNNNNVNNGQPITPEWIAATKSKKIFDRLDPILESKENLMVLQAVALKITCGKRLKESDLPVVKQRISDSPQDVYFPADGIVSTELFEQLVACKAALPLDLLSEVILPELIVTVLYSYGRLYFRQNKGNLGETPKVKQYIRDLETAQSLCDRVEKRFNVALAHALYCDRNALLYLCLEGRRKTRKEFQDDLEHAKYTYTQLLQDNKDYYQFGIIRMAKLKDDANHCILCRRQLIHCCINFIQLEIMPCAERAQLFAEGEVHSQKMIQLIEKQLQDGKSIPHLSACYNKAGEFALLFNDPEHNQEAIDYYTKAYVEEKKTGAVSMTYLDALLGLANSHKEQELFREGVFYAQQCVDAASSILGYSHHRDRANRLKREMKTRQNKDGTLTKATV